MFVRRVQAKRTRRARPIPPLDTDRSPLDPQHHLLTAPELKEVVVVEGGKFSTESVCLCVVQNTILPNSTSRGDRSIALQICQSPQKVLCSVRFPRFTPSQAWETNGQVDCLSFRTLKKRLRSPTLGQRLDVVIEVYLSRSLCRSEPSSIHWLGLADPAEMQSCKDLHGVDEWASESSIPYRASDHRELLDKIRQTVKQNIPSPSPSAAETSIPCISDKDYHRCGRGIDEPSYRWAFTQLKKDTSFTVEQVNSAMVSPTQVDMAEVGTPVVIVPITDKGRGTYGKGLPGCQGVRGVVNLPFERAVLRL